MQMLVLTVFKQIQELYIDIHLYLQFYIEHKNNVN